MCYLRIGTAFTWFLQMMLPELESRMPKNLAFFDI